MDQCRNCRERWPGGCRLAVSAAQQLDEAVRPAASVWQQPPGFRLSEQARLYYPLLCAAHAVLDNAARGYWRSGMLWQLRHVRIRITPVYRDAAQQVRYPQGRTIPLLSSTIDLREDVASRVDCHSLQVLLHELAHRCGAVLPEWKLWLKGRYPQEQIYGRGVNSADSISMDLLERYCPHCRWPDVQ